ncbi:hypothetical protein [Flexithrix dorotheae]|uniref:hypothetical protein n=1 Tax=Flexithrix dorotheae TaxID=70993 RepID=UPI00035D9808|nr:hypothetical protein [Flexithrix dorotheae]
MDIKIVVVLISGAIALLSAILGIYNQNKITTLNHQFNLQSRELDKKEEFEKLLSRYRDPLLRATCDFQSRLYNIIQIGFLKIHYDRSERERDYAINNTLFVTAEYLGWIEIIRTEIQFLDLGENSLTKNFNEIIERISHIFLSAKYDLTYRLLRGEQRAIGEIMIEKSDQRLLCIGYAEFRDKMNDSKFSFWFDTLVASIEVLAKNPESKLKRMIMLQHALIDLIDFLDPDSIRVSANRRSKIDA